MNEMFDKGFWTAGRRAWLYKVAVSMVPLLVAMGIVAQDIAQLILNVVAAILAVGASGLALSNVTPDNIIKVGLKLEQRED
jgi:hypothetical protein